MTDEAGVVPENWKQLIDEEFISRCISRISYEIVERNRDLSRLAIVGVRTGGEVLGKRIRDRIKKIEDIEIPFGVIDITLYRDDLSNLNSQPILKGTELPFPVSGSTIILVDDVLYSGRTVRAALDAIIDFGRPQSVQLAILVDRGHRELPIRPDFIGKNIPTNKKQSVHVRFREQGFEDGVYISDRRPKKVESN
ncbi:MAG: bifunctional pyr operon transcriptional regulator/uracil phosphoribosyltransferase PyrR [Bdellovibrionales bacterium]|nr:bifunctional pyr operon transcriptional regulator/uracil phosphoribosyltransferase PyrR [Bdellovibrionales bacterium]